MNYQVGDTVVCIDSLAQTTGQPLPGLQLGAEYKVHSIGPCVQMEGCFHPKFPFAWGMTCSRCRRFVPANNRELSHFTPHRFIKLDGLVQEQGEYEGALA